MNNSINVITESNLQLLINGFDLANETIGDNNALNLLLTGDAEFQDFDEINSFYMNVD